MIRDRSSGPRRNRLLGGLSTSAFSLLSANLKEVSLTQGMLLQEEHKKIEYVYFPHHGLIALVVIMEGEQAIETATIGREGALGTMSGLISRPAFTRATVQIAGIASRITASHFRRAVRGSNPVRDLVINYQEALLAQVERTAACNALHAVQFRLGRWLLQSRDSTESDTILLTQAGLSQMFGVRRSAVSSAARVLQGADLIRYRRGQIEILDRCGLERTTCKCYDVIRRQVH